MLAKAAEKEQALQQLRAANEEVPGPQTLNPRNLNPTRYAQNPTPGAAAAARRQRRGAFDLLVLTARPAGVCLRVHISIIYTF